jgi:hypothetical protein
MDTPPKKKAKRGCIFTPTDELHPCMKTSQRGTGYALCEIYRQDVSVVSGRMYDINKHVSKPKHQANAKAASGSADILRYVAINHTEHDDAAVSRAEVLFTGYVLNTTFPLLSLITQGHYYSECFLTK